MAPMRGRLITTRAGHGRGARMSFCSASAIRIWTRRRPSWTARSNVCARAIRTTRPPPDESPCARRLPSSIVAAPGDEVIAFEPLYPTYPAAIEVSGARMVRAPASPAAGFRVDPRSLEGLITPKTRALFFATPNNPSGVILSESDLAVIGDLARRHGLWVVVDEVYAGLAPGGRVPSLAASLPDQVVTISSLSKSHAMPGWRAGWMVGPPTLIAHVESLAICMLYGLPGFVQEAALTALGLAPAAESRIRDYCAQR